jgi:hypothetical protein
VSDDIFTKRGIPLEIKEARPYTPWEVDDPAPVRAAYGGLGTNGLKFALDIAEQSPGYLIERYPPEGLGLEDIYPEFRPDNAVRTDRRRKWHQHVHEARTTGERDLSGKPPKGTPPEMLLAAEAPKRIPPKWGLSGKALRDHVNRGSIRYLLYDAAAGPLSGVDEARVTAALAAASEAALREVSNDSTQDELIEQVVAQSLKVGRPGVAVYGPVGVERKGIRTPPDQNPTEHCGIDRWDFHYHESWAKYVFPPSPLIDKTWTHDHQVKTRWHEHDLLTDRWLAKHIAAEHDGLAPARDWKHPHTRAREWSDGKLAEHLAKPAPAGHDGIDVDGEHTHTRRVKNKNSNLARRLDVHPLAMEKIRTAKVVFFVIEGCLKADSILAKGAAVFSVPSVSLWDCPELEAFAKTYLRDKEVVIVPDADWTDNQQVISQARLCRATLNRHGVARVHIAAPPVNGSGYPYRGKGVDDFLGDEGHGELGELQTVDFYLSPETKKAIDRLLERCTRTDQYVRDRTVLESMALFAGPTGRLPSSLGMVGRVIDIDRRLVGEAVKQLIAWGVLTTDDDLAIRRQYWSGLDWRYAPVIELAEPYRAQKDERRQLGDVVCGSLTTP